jgi:hypothetical protein
MSWHPVLSGGPAVIKGTFAISAARQIRDRLNMRPPDLNIYTSQSNTDNARFCRDEVFETRVVHPRFARFKRSRGPGRSCMPAGERGVAF